jgi:hypothetical protein
MSDRGVGFKVRPFIRSGETFARPVSLEFKASATRQASGEVGCSGCCAQTGERHLSSGRSACASLSSL